MSAIAGLVSEPATEGHVTPALPVGLHLVLRRVEGAEWDRIVSGFDCVCKEQLHAFAAIRWPSVVLEPQVFALDGRVVGGALMMVQSLPLGVSQIAIAKWAPMLADSKAADARTIYAGMINALVAEYAERRGMLISILPHASIEEPNPQFDILTRRGFQRGAGLPYPSRYLINLRLGDEEQRASFAQAWRRQLRRAEKSDLVFERASAQRLDEFKALYDAMSDRKQFRDHSAYETLDGLMELDEPLRPELFFVRHGSELVAGAVVFKAGERASYLYGATNDKALPLRAGYYLHWHVIRWLRDHSQADWYDLGGTDGYSGLHQFKKGMVGERGVIRPLPPAVNFASRPVAFRLGTAALNLRETFNSARRWIDHHHPSGVRPDMVPYAAADDTR